MNYLIMIIVVIIYLIITAFLGYLGFKQTKDSTDYLLAGRKTHPVIMAISYGSTFISTSAIIGFGAAASIYGFGILWLVFMNIFVGIFIAFAFFGIRTRKMGHNLDAHTFPEFIGKRFDSKFLQWGSGLLIFFFMPLYTASVIIGGSQFLSQSLSISYEVALLFFVAIVSVYVIMGGLKGVMYTDAFQGAIMFIGMLILIIFTYSKLGGIINAHKSLSSLAPEAIKIWGSLGHQGWTKMPVFNSIQWWQLVSSIIMGVGIGVLAQPQLVVRFMTVKSGHEINRANLIGGIFILVITGSAYIVGSLTNVYFYNTMGKISFLAVDKKTDNIIPLYISNAMPDWFTAIFMITLLAAAMSTLSSQFHTMGSAFGRDFLEKGLNIKAKNSLLVTKLSMSFAIILSALLAYYLPHFFEKGSTIIAIGTSLFFGLCASVFLPIYIGAVFSKRITKAGAISCFVSGLVASLIWMLFFHIKESKAIGLCFALFKVDSLAKSAVVQNIDPLFIGLPISTLFTIIVSIFTKKVPEKVINKAFKGMK
ncbi:MAG: sodium:solute symporter family protein [Brevinematales bacterium]|nr:sodium:solute symporter family protein [Brevinematales bacterium]